MSQERGAGLESMTRVKAKSLGFYFVGSRQWSPTFLAPGTCLWKTVFPRQGGSCFQDDSSTLYLLCTLFLFLLHQLHLRSSGIRSQSLGTLVLRSLSRLFSRAMLWSDCPFREIIQGNIQSEIMNLKHNRD